MPEGNGSRTASPKKRRSSPPRPDRRSPARRQRIFDARRVVSGYIINNKGVRAGVQTGTAIFDLAGRKIYDLKGNNIYRLTGELVGHLLDATGSDKRLDRDSEELLSVRERPEPDKPEERERPKRQPSADFAQAIRLRRMVSDPPRKG
jgi:hypothetical protein